MARDGRFSRFQNLEQERPARPSAGTDASAPTDASAMTEASVPADGSAQPHPPGSSRTGALDPTSSRFGALDFNAPGAAPSPPSSAEGHLARFDAPKEAAVTVSRETDEAQPFLRCRACESDNSRYAQSCINCGADLTTPDQREFNERLWAERRVQQAQEREAHAQHQAAQLEAAAQLKKDQRAYYEELARKAGDEARARLGEPGGWMNRPVRGFRFGGGSDSWIVRTVVVAIAVVLMTFFKCGIRSSSNHRYRDNVERLSPPH